MLDVIIYGRLSCPHTRLAIKRAKKISHTFIDIGKITRAHKKQLAKYEHRTVPAIFVKYGRGYRFIGGSEEFLSLLDDV